MLKLALRGQIYEECNTSRQLISYLYPLMYLELMCLVGTHPAFNIYISLFWGVLKSYIGYLLIYGLLLICFAVGYLQMFGKAEEEEELAWPSGFLFLVMHVFNMFLGTLELENIKWADPEEGPSRRVQLIYVFIFAVLIMLTLLNLLNALAIDDVNRMIEKSETKRLYTILSLVVFWEERFRKLSSPSRMLKKIFTREKSSEPAETFLRHWYTILKEKDKKKLYFKAYQDREIKFSLMNIVTYGPSNGRTLEGYNSIREGQPSGFTITKRLADQAIEIFHDRTRQAREKEEKGERKSFFEKVMNDTSTLRKVTEDMESRTVNMERGLNQRIDKIEEDIRKIIRLLETRK